jgi:O-antigen ligase
MSGDVAGGFHRIPAIFSSAHAYGGTMVASIPFLVGLWIGAQNSFHKLLGLIAVPAALLGVLLSATRTSFLFACAMIAFVLFAIRIKSKHRVLFLVILGALAVAAMSNARFQRFKSLDDTESVAGRIAGSVNRTFWDILTEYPLGNGLGGGGTSMPYFLQGQVRNPIGMENEYARILCEQGIIGLVIWLSFLVWAFSRVRVTFAKNQWAIPKRLMWGYALTLFGTAWIGTGLLTSIPATVLLIMGMGWIVVPTETLAPGPRDRVQPFPRRPVRTPVPALR